MNENIIKSVSSYVLFYGFWSKKIPFEDQFNKISKIYQDAYMNANCDVLIPYLNENLVIFENGDYWPYEQVKAYCLKLPVKPVLSINRSYKVISDALAYEYVSQIYQRKGGRLFNETSSRLWT